MKIPRVLVVAGLLLAVVTAASGVPYTDPSYVGPVVISVDDKASGTSYPAGAFPGIPGPGGRPPEDSWGIFFVQTIYKGQVGATGAISAIPGGKLWGDTDGGRELVGIYWNVQDIAVSLDPGSGTQTIESVGMQFAIWEQDSGTLGANWNAGTTVRGANPWDYPGIGTAGNPVLWATGNSVPGFLGVMVPGVTEYVSTFNPTVGAGNPAGGAKVYLEVNPNGAGVGSYNTYLDTNFYASPISTADLYLDMATTLNNPANQQAPGDDWTVWSNDDATGVIVPEPMTVLAVFLGIGSLGGYVRKRTRV